MNHAIIFKYPNFPERTAPKTSGGWSGRPEPAEDFRPIETGIYVPYDSEHPRDGGSAIYLRQKNYEPLMREYLGLKTEAEQETLQKDMVILNLLDTVPSLDPFLVKDCLDANGIAFHEEYLKLDPMEVFRIRQAISVKITEIIDKAFATEGRSVADKERMLEALWDPKLPEAHDFVAAFGIGDAEAPLVFSAWKGITYYQVQLRDVAPKVSAMMTWFASKDSIPFDAAQNRGYKDQFAMFKDRIVKKLAATADETRTIMRNYESCHAEFLAGKPRNLVGFLKSARRTYWVLASCISALNSAATILFTDVKPARENRLFFDEQNSMFQRLDVVLTRKRDVPASF